MAAGRLAHVFHPPTSPVPTALTPSLTTTTPSFVTATDYFSSGSRKRARPDLSHEADLWPAFAATPSWAQYSSPIDASFNSLNDIQDAALADEKYVLKGGFDTPSLLAAAEIEQLPTGPKYQHFRRLRDMDIEDRVYSEHESVFGALARSRNGVACVPSSHNGESQLRAGWKSLAAKLVGKVIQFSGSMIRGFYAGGGQGYQLHDSPLEKTWPPQHAQYCSTPVPGSWREEDEFMGDFEQENPDSVSSSRPPGKRRQIDRTKWVIVRTTDLEDSPKRKASMSSLRPARPALQNRPSSYRRRIAFSRRQRSNVSLAGSPGVHATPASPTAPSRRGSTHFRSESSSVPVATSVTTYITPEAEKYVKRRAEQEQRSNETMIDMGRRLKDLIRQGQEALGTKVEVCDEMDESGDTDCRRGVDIDEGFMDEELCEEFRFHV